MGLFDKLLKKNTNKQEQNINTIPVEQKGFSASFETTNDGRLQIDFLDNQAKFSSLYDTTRLVINPQPIIVAGQHLYNCKVSWYGLDDCCYKDEETGKFERPRANDYREVLMQLDLNLLKTDPDYCDIVMKGLLDQQRVDRYLKAGLEETPEFPCGQYIGGIIQKENGYRKFFNQNVGIASHNSKLMVERREKVRSNIAAQKRREIEAKDAKIKQLQLEIDELNNKYPPV